ALSLFECQPTEVREQGADAFRVLYLAGNGQPLVTIGPCLSIIALFLRNLPELQQDTGEATPVLQCFRSSLSALELFLGYWVETAHEQKWGECVGATHQLRPPTFHGGCFKGSKDDTAFQFEQFVVFFVRFH